MGSMKQTLKSASETHNLPLYLTPFVGREAELAELARLMADPDRRLLTLVGPGGIGKTRLGIRLATELLPQHRDGVWLVEFAALSDPALVPQVVASALGVSEQPERPLSETLVASLKTRHLLLVLDNCEHLLDACGQLAHSLLAASPTLRIMATSREPLHVAGEVHWLVPPLSLPDPERLSSLENLVRYEAVRLFVDRAKAVFPSFTLTGENAPAVAQICYRLDGLPLPIELAAARVKVLSVAQIAARLDDRFRLLVAGSRTESTRQQTLRATLDWSHDLLPEREQVLFRRLAVFAGDFSLEAAETVCTGRGLDQARVLELLSGLVDKSLVMVEQKGSQERRYRLLETVRQYGLEKLRISGEEPALGTGHLAWYLALAEEVQPYLWGATEAASLARLQAEQDNWRAALQWSLENGKAEESLRLAAALAWYWYVRAHLREGRQWLEQALAASDKASTSSRAAALAAAGALAVQQGDREQATVLLQQAISLRCEPGCANLAGWSMLNLGLLALFGGDFPRAEQLLDQSMALFRELGDPAGAATVLLYQGIATCYQGDYGDAAALLQESLPLLRKLGDTIGVARALHGLGMAARHQDDLARSKASFEEALQVAGEKSARLEVSQCLEGLAGVACAQGQPKRAARLFGAAEALREAIGADQPSGISADHARDVADTRTQLEETTFQAAWATGRLLTLDQIVAYALVEADSAEPGSDAEDGPGSRSLTPLQAAKRRYGGLTARERQVAALVAQGKSNSTIAAELVVTVRTVEAHITHILRKLGFSSRTQIAAWAVNKGLAPPPKTLEEEMDDAGS
jgi:predicted ATPase/DNA-binding CsgD family transcriptional regulator